MLLNRENKENRQVVLTIQVERDPWEIGRASCRERV